MLLPWGSLLRAVACAERDGLARLRQLCRTGAEVRFVFGYGASDASSIQELGLPSLDQPQFLVRLESGYREAGFEVKAAEISREAIRALSTSWSGRLAFSGSERRFIELRGHATTS